MTKEGHSGPIKQQEQRHGSREAQDCRTVGSPEGMVRDILGQGRQRRDFTPGSLGKVLLLAEDYHSPFCIVETVLRLLGVTGRIEGWGVLEGGHVGATCGHLGKRG